MKRGIQALLILAGSLVFSLTLMAKVATFTGNISDSMCNLHHMMTNVSAKDCTESCVKQGAKYVLADETHKKVYQLDNQTLPAKFPGANVVVKGEIEKDGSTIHVISITAAKK